MVRSKIGRHLLTSDESELLVRIFKDQQDTKAFIRFLKEVGKMYQSQYEQASEAYMMNDEAISRAVALQYKGKVGCISDLVKLLEAVNK